MDNVFQPSKITLSLCSVIINAYDTICAQIDFVGNNDGQKKIKVKRACFAHFLSIYS